MRHESGRAGAIDVDAPCVEHRVGQTADGLIAQDGLRFPDRLNDIIGQNVRELLWRNISFFGIDILSGDVCCEGQLKIRESRKSQDLTKPNDRCRTACGNGAQLRNRFSNDNIGIFGDIFRDALERRRQ